MSSREERFREIVSGADGGVWAGITRAMLRGGSLLYSLVMYLRRRLYRAGTKRSYDVSRTVVSIGNITVGGTGKTPLVAWVVGQLLQMGRRPAILTRGYKAFKGLSDEAEMLSRVTGVPVVVNSDRVAGARKAIADGAEVVVLDDGFQHLRLRRDLDIVTIDASCPFGYEAVLPRGLLREPLSALRDAEAVVITRSDQVDPVRLGQLRERIAGLAGGACIAETAMKPTRLVWADGASEPAEALSGRKVWAFCGLGNPDGFYRTLTDIGVRLLGHTSFDDHHPYTDDDLRELAEHADAVGASVLVTTAKDAVKLTGRDAARPMGYVEVEVAFTAGRDALRERLVAIAASGKDQPAEPAVAEQ